MDSPSLTDRYVSAVIRRLPGRQRGDVARELHGSIADQIDARIEAGEAADSAERDTITQFGDPEALAAGFADRPLSLIGPRYFLVWKRLLVLLLWIVPVCAAVGVTIGTLIEGAGAGEVIGTVFVVTMSVIVHLAFWVTLVFAILDRIPAGGDADPAPWTIADLPDPKQGGAASPT